MRIWGSEMSRNLPEDAQQALCNQALSAGVAGCLFHGAWRSPSPPQLLPSLKSQLLRAGARCLTPNSLQSPCTLPCPHTALPHSYLTHTYLHEVTLQVARPESVWSAACQQMCCLQKALWLRAWLCSGVRVGVGQEVARGSSVWQVWDHRGPFPFFPQADRSSLTGGDGGCSPSWLTSFPKKFRSTQNLIL